MTLDRAYINLLQSHKKYKLLEAGYKCTKCEHCKGSGVVWDTKEAVFHQNPNSGYITCKCCNGEGSVWITPIIR